MDSNANELGNRNQHEKDGYESRNKLCYSVYEVEEIYNNSRGSDCHDENECCNNTNFLYCYTNDFAIVSSSCYPNDNHSWEKICEAFFLILDEILVLLARDFEKHVSVSKDLHILPHNVSSFNQVTSPKFHVERDIESKQSLSDFGGVYSSTSNVFAHDDLLDEGDVSEGKFDPILDSSHVNFFYNMF